MPGALTPEDFLAMHARARARAGQPLELTPTPREVVPVWAAPPTPPLTAQRIRAAFALPRGAYRADGETDAEVRGRLLGEAMAGGIAAGSVEVVGVDLD